MTTNVNKNIGVIQKKSDGSIVRRFDTEEDAQEALDKLGAAGRKFKVGKTVANVVDHRYENAKNKISDELLMCLFWLESKFNTNAKSNVGAIGLGQLTPIGAKEIDKFIRRQTGKNPKPTSMDKQKTGNACHQRNNTLMLLSIYLVKKGNIRDALKQYGPMDAPHGEYSDIILKCEKCLKASGGRKATADNSCVWKDKECKTCFDAADDARKEVRKKRGL